MKVYTLCLDSSITTGWNTATKSIAGDSGTVSWMVDWDNLFGKINNYSTCKIKFILKGKSSVAANYSLNNDFNTLRANLPSVFQNQINQTVLGFVETQFDPMDNTKVRMAGDSSMGLSPMIWIPRGYQNLTLQMFGIGEKVVTIPDDYIVMLMFELD